MPSQDKKGTRGVAYQCPLCGSGFIAKNRKSVDIELDQHVDDKHKTASGLYDCIACSSHNQKKEVKSWHRHQRGVRHSHALKQLNANNTTHVEHDVGLESTTPPTSFESSHEDTKVLSTELLSKLWMSLADAFKDHLSWLEKYLPDNDPKLNRTAREGYEFRRTGKDLSETTRELIRLWREGLVTEANMRAILELLRNPPKDKVPESLEKLEQKEKESYPFPGQYKVTTPGVGADVYFFDMKEVLAMIYSDHKLRQSSIFSYYLPLNGRISHPMNSEGANEYNSFKAALEKKAKKKFDWLLLPNVFIDEFEKSDTRNQKDWVISFTPANLSKREYLRTENKYVLCVVPAAADLDIVLREVVIKPLLELERGLDLKLADGQIVSACGSLHLLLGDHPGESKIVKLIGPRAGFPDRFHVVHRNDLDMTHLSAERTGKPFPPLRDSLRTYALLKDTVSAAQGCFLEMEGCRSGEVPGKTEAIEVLRSQGLLPEQSCLWDLVWFRPNFFKRIGLCYMHLELRGLWTRHTLYTFSRLSPEMREAVNQQVIKLSESFPTLRSLRRGIVTEYVSRKVKRPILKLRAFTAEEILHWIMISPLCFLSVKNFPKELFDVWMEHMRADEALWRENYSVEEALTEIQLLQCKWREKFKRVFCEDFDEKEQDLYSSEESDLIEADELVEDLRYMKQQKGYEDDEEESDDSESETEEEVEERERVKEKEREEEIFEKEDFEWETPRLRSVKPKKLRQLPGSELLEGSMAKGKFPNFFSANFWGMSLAWGGPVWVADTKSYEAKIKTLKQWMKRTNHKFPERDTLVKEGQHLGYRVKNEQMTARENRHRPDCTLFGGKSKFDLSEEESAEVLSLLTDEELAGRFLPKAIWKNGIRFGGKMLRVGKEDQWGFLLRDANCDVLLLEKVFTLKLGIDVFSFAKAKQLRRLAKNDVRIDCPLYVEELSCLVRTESLDVEKVVHLVRHPTRTKATWIVNRWLRVEILPCRQLDGETNKRSETVESEGENGTEMSCGSDFTVSCTEKRRRKQGEEEGEDEEKRMREEMEWEQKRIEKFEKVWSEEEEEEEEEKKEAEEDGKKMDVDGEDEEKEEEEEKEKEGGENAAPNKEEGEKVGEEIVDHYAEEEETKNGKHGKKRPLSHKAKTKQPRQKRRRYANRCEKEETPDDDTPMEEVPTGLVNFGATCWLNAIVQCIRFTSPEGIHASRKTGSSITKSFVQLCKEMAEGKQRSLRLLTDAIQEEPGFENIDHQQDAHEFLQVLFREETLQLPFQFPGIQYTYCPSVDCGYFSREETTYNLLPLTLPLSSSKLVLFKDLIRDFSIDPDAKCRCGSQRKKFDVLHFEEASSLVFQIVRFHFDRKRKTTRKLKHRVQIPETIRCGTDTFELVATCNHYGETVESGHYKAFIWHGGKNFCMNDYEVSELKESVLDCDEFRSSVYLLFFRKTTGEILTDSISVDDESERRVTLDYANHQRVLEDGACLTDVIVEDFLRDLFNDPLLKPCHWVSTLEEKEQQNQDLLNNHALALSLRPPSQDIFVSFFSGQHFRLFVVNRESETMELYDSLGPSWAKKIVSSTKSLQAFFCKLPLQCKTTLTIPIVKAHQETAVDCGVFLCLYALRKKQGWSAAKIAAKISQSQIRAMRNYIFYTSFVINRDRN